MTTRVVDARVPLFQNIEAALEKLNGVTAQLEKLNPQNAQLIKDLHDRVSSEGVKEDTLIEIVSFVLAAENGGSIQETVAEAQSVREQARKIREETVRLERTLTEMRKGVQDLSQVLDAKVANTQRIRDLSKKS